MNADYAGIQNRNENYEAVVSSLESFRTKCNHPTMYTFFEPANVEYDHLLIELENWKNAWRDAGWKPFVLSLEDAQRHPDFDIFKDAFDNAVYQLAKYDRFCFYRWLAMAVSGGKS